MTRAVKALALVPVALLLCAPVGAQAKPSGPDEPVVRPGVAKPLLQADRDYYFTNVADATEETAAADQKVGTAGARVQAKKSTLDRLEAKRSTGFPPAAKQLARREALATTKDVSPRETARQSGQDNVQRARLLTLLVEFNPEANDDFSGWERPNDDPTNPAVCITEPAGTLLNGPLHNQIPDPATIGRGTDNNTFWVPDFNRSFYQKLIYSTEGVQRRIRPELNGGVDISGRTVKNYYLEVSKGRYVLEGTASPWLMLDHSEAWYSADSCEAGEASDVGHPDNPLGTGKMAFDAVAALAEAQPNFPWADYDVEDQGDRDGDGNLFEPDGALDHVIVLHAGKDQASGGGAEGTYAEWSSSSVVGATTGGLEVPGTGGLRVLNYTTQPENAGVGVVAHEYGHDLGLPDLYDSIGPTTDTDVGWWDLMSTGSHSGQLFQVLPTHMGAWSKYVLGWIEPEVLEYGDPRANFTLGQGSRPPRGTDEAVKVNLPAKRVQVGEPHSGDTAWWSSDDQSYADVRLTRTVEVPAGSDVRFWSWNDYVIEELWDYGFIEVSTDGENWTQLEVFDEDGNMVSTDDDPNGNLAGLFGDLENGLTGTTGGYRHDYVQLTPYAGSTIQLRLRYLTDPAFEERGWFADDFSVTADGTTVWSDGVEDGLNGWAADPGTLTDTTGNGWVQTSGTFDYEQYYLAEWRNFDGYDNGLRTPYATNWVTSEDEWNVTRTPYNAPGLLIWHRDQAHSINDLSNNLFDPPSVGSKGTVLLVDSHFNPARLRGAAAEANPSLLDNLSSRQQAADVAFGPVGRYPFRYCVPADPDGDPFDVVCNNFGTRNPVTRFTDGRTWYPGFEYRPDLDEAAPLFFRDVDASTVVPSLGNEIYSTRIVDRNGQLLPELYGTDLGSGHVLGTGNPRDGRPAIEGGDPGTTADLSLGVAIQVIRASNNNKQVQIWVRPGHPGGTPSVTGTAER